MKTIEFKIPAFKNNTVLTVRNKTTYDGLKWGIEWLKTHGYKNYYIFAYVDGIKLPTRLCLY